MTKTNETLAILASLFEATPDFVCIADATDGHFLFLNKAARRMAGKEEKEDLSGLRLEDIHPAGAMAVLRDEGIPSALLNGSWAGESTVLNREGREIPVSQVIVSHRTPTGNVHLVSTVMRDLTERNKLENQLRQSQKMDAIGRLAGGVCHDFNNLLTVIAGYSEIVLAALPLNDVVLRPDVQAISDAGGRAASLTRQMLTFSRHTVFEPTVVDLNVVVLEAESMLRRLIGENIILTTVLNPIPQYVKIDPALFGQVLMNLAVNARDAMSSGGKLTIETCYATRQRGRISASHEAEVCDYVMLAATDSGTGMTATTRERIFEPFFTTKEIDKGTGLGLSVVHGIIKQSNGHIEVYSELGVGTSFKIFIPAVKGQSAEVTPLNSDKPVKGVETILLVEDEAVVRGLARSVFLACGYEVLTAVDGRDAMRVVTEYHGKIDILVTDVVMPRMGGRELAEALRPICPNMKVLFTSGYTDDAVVRHGILQKEVFFLQKPYTPRSLTKKVRDVLDEAASLAPQINR